MALSAAATESCDPGLRSWVSSANHPETDFPVQNLPYGVFRRGGNEEPRIGVAIGDAALDLRGLADSGALAVASEFAPELLIACRAPSLNALMALGRRAQRSLRSTVSRLLTDQAQGLRVEPHLVPQPELTMLLPVTVGDYTDFYASVFHATNVGRLFRPDNPLLPNYKYVPIGYHGRASSVVVSGTAVQRPQGQLADASGGAPRFAPSRLLDYELEMGAFVGAGNALGQTIPLAEAMEHLFGLCLLNDWSARDMQAWEYQPLGPFLAKSFATTISPWVVTLDALEPFRVAAFPRPAGDPAPLPYLADASDRSSGGFDIQLEVFLQTAAMRGAGAEPALLSRSNLRDLYWTLPQLVTHHASNGCNLRAGDLLGTGTVSGPDSETLPTARGCLLEITERGAHPVRLPDGESRAFLEDGDEIIFRAHCQRPGAVRIGFGECRGRILPARPAFA